MNFQKISELFFEFSEKLLTYVINTVYVILLILPLILVDLVVKESILKLPLLFIPLVSLYPMALKSLTYSFYKIYFKNNLYYKPFFFHSLKDNFIKQYCYYVMAISLLYFGLTSTFVLINKVSELFWLTFALIILIILSNMIYTTLQFALYEKRKIMETVKNSLILSVMYGIITIGMVIILSTLIYFFQGEAFKVITLGLPLFSIVLIFIHMIIEKNKVKN